MKQISYVKISRILNFLLSYFIIFILLGLPTKIISQNTVPPEVLSAMQANEGMLNTISRLAEECANGEVESCNRLTEVAKNNSDCEIRKKAIELLLDTSVINFIALNADSKCPQLQTTAIKRVVDSSILADIALNSTIYNARLWAIKNDYLNDQKLLAKIVNNEQVSWVRKAALEKITDQGLLAVIAKTEKDDDVRFIAYTRLLLVGQSPYKYAWIKDSTSRTIFYKSAGYKEKNMTFIGQVDQLSFNQFEGYLPVIPGVHKITLGKRIIRLDTEEEYYLREPLVISRTLKGGFVYQFEISSNQEAILNVIPINEAVLEYSRNHGSK